MPGEDLSLAGMEWKALGWGLSVAPAFTPFTTRLAGITTTLLSFAVTRTSLVLGVDSGIPLDGTTEQISL